MMARMSNLVHQSGAYSDVPIEDRGELVLPGGRLGEIAANGRPVGTPERIAAYLLTEYLERLGVEVIFGLCGHTLVGLLDAISKSKIRYVTARHEQVAAHMAEGYARATGKPGVLITHLGPGLTNAITGIANAALDSIPLVVIAGDVPSYYFGRHPHQEFNMHLDGGQFEMCRPFCKRVYRVDRADDLPRCIERAFHLAVSGRPGPVLVDVPMDHFSSNLFFDAFSKEPPFVAKPCLEPAMAQRIVEALVEAKNPVLYGGGGVTSALVPEAAALFTELAELLEMPVAHTLMGKGCMPDGHPLLAGQTGFWGTPVANSLCLEADYILAIGTRLAEANSSSWDSRYTFNIPPTKLIHIDIDAMEIGRNYPTFLGAISDSTLALEQLVKAARELKQRPKREGDLRRRIEESNARFKGHFTEFYTSDAFPLRPERILADLRAVLPEDGYVVTDVGWNKNGVAQQFPFKHVGSFITPSGMATMGFGAAAVLGIKLARPERAAVALIGDGGFCAANPSVIATAMEAKIPAIWLVMDNSAFGVIAGLEQAKYDTTFGTKFLRDGEPYHVDYAAIARAHGANGIDIKEASELKPAIEAALASELPTLIRIPMVNVPTPTPGHWNINDIYRAGE
ncbi:acetolactate synthase-1/2/3 large subunit [Bryocella elongata]|uniref:Acetolactate synthase-1/2/3 large subunit n=2 Tax=Bryocella elongata TaxID=863522 RepID=A0A1H6C5B7_9BACT|nr:acetolactate synthase-1/2/3 large subunit [Bryocella elongata]